MKDKAKQEAEDRQDSRGDIIDRGDKPSKDRNRTEKQDRGVCKEFIIIIILSYLIISGGGSGGGKAERRKSISRQAASSKQAARQEKKSLKQQPGRRHHAMPRHAMPCLIA